MLINLRDALMTGKRLPYDAEVEYLESTGTQYIDTGIVMTEDVGYEIRAMALTNQIIDPAGIVGADDFQGLYATVYATGGDVYAECSSLEMWMLFSDAVYNEDFTVRMNFLNDQMMAFVGPDRSEEDWIGGLPNIASPNITVFKILDDKFSKARVYSLKISKGAAIVRDFIPVRKGTVGYLYDRVSGKLFGNDGTGDFVLGPDKN